MDLSRVHLTTAQFGQVLPLFCEETIPGDKFNVSADYFSRMAPLVKPTYGKVSFHTMTSFVPYYQVADDFEAFVAGKVVWEGETPTLRYFELDDFCKWLIDIGSAVTSAVSYDFAYVDSAGAQRYLVFKDYAKYWVKIMNSLGYALPTLVDYRTSSDWYSSCRTTKLSALPLLAFAKAYNDYMSMSTRYNQAPLTEFLKKVKHNKAISGSYNASTGQIYYPGLNTIMAAIRICYETDYFISAWQKPNAPVIGAGGSGNESLGSVAITYADGAGGSVTQTNNVNSVQTQISYNLLSQRALDFLKGFDDWVRRNNYSGSRVVQQIYSRFGVKTDDYRSNYAHVIDTDILPIQVGDVTSQATTDATIGGASVTTGLGDYAGKGILSGGKGFSFESNDYGMLFVFGWFTVAPMNSFGFDRSVLRSQPLDWYNPEFDGVGVDSISAMEVATNPIALAVDGGMSDSDVFGFTERYNSYRFGRDKITGEFRNYHTDADMNVWHTGRYVNDLRETGALVAQNTDFVTMSPKDSEFNRIFSQIDGSSDKFYLTAQFKVNAVRPMLSLNEVPRLGEGNTSVPRNGNVVD